MELHLVYDRLTVGMLEMENLRRRVSDLELERFNVSERILQIRRVSIGTRIYAL